jgi:hypothetical protein
MGGTKASKPGLNRRVFSFLAGILPLVFAHHVLAAGDADFTVQGFGTLGATRTTSDEVDFVRDLSQPRGAGKDWDARVDSVFGVQAHWQISRKLEVTGQVVSRYRYDRTFTPEFSWAYLKYEPSPNLSLRAGRLGTDFFMMADSRLVGYSYLPVRPPGDFFWSLPFYSLNGADAVMTLPAGEHLFRGKLFYGISDGYLPLGGKQWVLNGSTMAGGYLDYLVGAWHFRAGYANLRFKHDLPLDEPLQASLPPAAAAQAADFLGVAHTSSHYYSLGAAYDRGPWQVHLMLNHCDQGSQTFESSDSGYFLAGYRVASVTPYFGYSWASSVPRQGALNPVVGAIMADTHVDQKTTIVGARWDLAKNLALKAQWDGIRGEPTSKLPYRRDQTGWLGKMDVFSLTMDFIF